MQELNWVHMLIGALILSGGLNVGLAVAYFSRSSEIDRLCDWSDDLSVWIERLLGHRHSVPVPRFDNRVRGRQTRGAFFTQRFKLEDEV